MIKDNKKTDRQFILPKLERWMSFVLVFLSHQYMISLFVIPSFTIYVHNPK
jgi:hypothetical protein